MTALTCRPIGHLETPWATTSECPRNGRQPDPPPLCRAVLAPEFRPGLTSLEGFSHLILLYWLDREPGTFDELVFTPRFDDQPRGVFATRTPRRPNPIGLSVVKLLGIDDGVLSVQYLDCVNGTPLLDIKPYLPRTDSEPRATVGWLAQTRSLHATEQER